MDVFLALIGFLLVLLGILGSFLPVLPGPPTSWLGLFLLHLTDAVPQNGTYLLICLGIALIATLLDYLLPSLSTQKFGGSKKGVWGCSIGLIVGLFLGPLGILFGPFVGAFLGELFNREKDVKKALKAALGAFVGFLFSTVLKAVISVVFLVHYLEIFWKHRSDFF